MTVHCTVLESEAKKSLNTPGGDEFLKTVGGPDGLPFLVFLDEKGTLIVNSQRPTKPGKTENIGHPYQPEEVDWFMKMLSKAAPRMTTAEAGTLEKWLRNQPK